MATYSITILAGRALAQREAGSSNPFCKVTYRQLSTKKLKKFKTKQKKRALDPVWNEVFQLPSYLRYGDEILLECWHQGKSLEFLGQHIVQLEETHLTGQFSEWIPLRARGDPSDGPITGDIFIAFSKVTDGPPPSPQPEARDSPPTERASLTSSCQSAGSSSSSSSSSTSSSLAPSPKAKHRRRHSSGNDDIVPDASPSPSQPTGLSPSISARLQGITGFKKKFGTVESRGGKGARRSINMAIGAVSRKDELAQSAPSLLSFSATPTRIDLKPGAVPVLGIPLEVLLERQADRKPPIEIPLYFHRALRELKKRKAYMQEGIFRVEANQEELAAALSEGDALEFASVKSVHVIAGIVKLFLRELPEPLLTFHFYEQYVEGIDENSSLPGNNLLIRAVQKIPASNFVLLNHLMSFVQLILKYTKDNKMDAQNLSIVLGPNLLRRDETRVHMDENQNLKAYRSALGILMKLTKQIILISPEIFPSQPTPKREIVKRKDGELYMVTTEVEEIVEDHGGHDGDEEVIVEVVEVIEYE